MLQRFVRKWKGWIHDDLFTERSSAQSFLSDLLDFYDVKLPPGRMFEQHPFKLRKPVNGQLFEAPTKAEYTQESMDLYLPDICVWEMKEPKENLADHVEQAFRYWVPMQTRYVVLCNFRQFWVYDTARKGGTREPSIVLKLEDLPANPDALIFLRGEEPSVVSLSEQVTREIAGQLGRVIKQKVEEAEDKETTRARLTKFALECVFAMFAEDSELLPPQVFTVALEKSLKIDDLAPVYSLFMDFDRPTADERQNPEVPYINGPLYDSRYPAVKLEQGFIKQFYLAAKDFDWRAVRPEVFGNIFEQALDPHRRHELGAHFTAHNDIMKVVGPTVIRPWQERIEAARNFRECAELLNRLKHYHVLDPACGCGNFLYVAYRELKRLEYALCRKWERLHNQSLKRADWRKAPPGPYFTIEQLHGIDKQEWAVTLTRVVLWIAEQLANRELDLSEPNLPLADLSETIVQADALLAVNNGLPPRGDDDPRAQWPRPPDDGISELAIVGNPPFMGRHKMRQALTDAYVETLHQAYPANRNADLVTYWYTQALLTLKPGECAGFVSTNSIAQNESREASLDCIVAAGGTIHDAWQSYPWPGEAAVHVSIVNWLMGEYEGLMRLQDSAVYQISPMLTAGTDVTPGTQIVANDGICFEGVQPGNNGFVLETDERNKLVAKDPGLSAVVKPYLIGRDIAREIDQAPTRWVVDFNIMDKADAQKFRGAYLCLQKKVYPQRTSEFERKPDSIKEKWWQFKRPAPDMRQAIAGLSRYLVVARVSPFVLFVFADKEVLPDSRLKVFALNSFYHFGVLQSQIHELWAWARGATLKGDLSYTNTTIFETFPFPLHPAGGRMGRSVKHLPGPQDLYDPRKVPESREARDVGKIAEELYTKRQAACRALNLGLTKLYNYIKGKTPLSNLSTEHQELVRELQALHERLNGAVNGCYGWPEGTWRDENEVLKRLLALNQALTSD